MLPAKTLPITADVKEVARRYDPDRVTVGIFGSHSAIPLGIAARRAGLQTLVVVERGRDELYLKHNRHLFDLVLRLSKFSDMLNAEHVARMLTLNTIFVPNRSAVVYLTYDGIEGLPVPMYGNRALLRAEERTEPVNYYTLLDEAGVRRPRQYSDPSEIDGPVVVKAQQVRNPKERAFFYPKTPEEYEAMKARAIAEGLVTEESVRTARIEEAIVGPKFNANFHFYALPEMSEVGYDFVGTSDRRQLEPTKEEAGHMGVTARESFLPMFFRAADGLGRTIRVAFPPGPIGPMGIQGAIMADPKNDYKPVFVVFDLSFRVPGDPAIGPTSPEMENLSLKHEQIIKDPMDLIMLELKCAMRDKRLADVVT